jgi:hypothetical protein
MTIKIIGAFMFKKLYSKAVLSLMNSKAYHWFVLNVFPKLRFSNYYSDIEGWQYRRAYNLLQNGDLILSTDKKKASALAIPGKIKHVGIMIDKGAEWECSEMTHVGHKKSTFYDMCKEADLIVIVRCRNFDKEYIENVFIPNIRSHSGADYDVEFEFGVKSLYCSELVYISDSEKRLQLDTSDLMGLGQEYVSPTAIYESPAVDILFDSDKEPKPVFFSTYHR